MPLFWSETWEAGAGTSEVPDEDMSGGQGDDPGVTRGSWRDEAFRQGKGKEKEMVEEEHYRRSWDNKMYKVAKNLYKKFSWGKMRQAK